MQKRRSSVLDISKLFIYLYTPLPFDLEALTINTVVSTIFNCFFKGITKLDNSSDKVFLNIDNRKVKKFSR